MSRENLFNFFGCCKKFLKIYVSSYHDNRQTNSQLYEQQLRLIATKVSCCNYTRTHKTCIITTYTHRAGGYKGYKRI